MFGIFKKRKSNTDEAKNQIDNSLKQMGASVLLIIQSGKIVMTADILRDRPHDWLGGQAIEVMISSPGSDPYFIYYENDGYYFEMAKNGSRHSISNFQDYETYRNNVSQALCMFLILYLMDKNGKDIRHPQMSFSHNRIHTNVIAYVKKLNDWFPIQHSSEEDDFATERKVSEVNSGLISITDVIAVHSTSPE